MIEDGAQTPFNAARAEEGPPDGPRIVVADNDWMLRGVIRSALVRDGYRVAIAADGQEAVEVLRRAPAALTILDIHMPRLDGFAACVQIRHMPGLATTPILILTADARAAVRQACRVAGATELLLKPVSMDVLLARVARHARPEGHEGPRPAK